MSWNSDSNNNVLYILTILLHSVLTYVQPIKTGNEETMGCFLWMDDVVLINTNRNTLQEMT